jgi:PPE-SVP subfamily C-terminal region
MAYVNTNSAAIAAAASQLEGIGNSFSAESSAAAAPTTAGGAGIPAASTPVTLASQSWTAAPGAMSTGTPGTIAGIPALANGGRGGSSFGAPRYGVKPKVMPPIPKPTLT